MLETTQSKTDEFPTKTAYMMALLDAAGGDGLTSTQIVKIAPGDFPDTTCASNICNRLWITRRVTRVIDDDPLDNARYRYFHENVGKLGLVYERRAETRETPASRATKPLRIKPPANFSVNPMLPASLGNMAGTPAPGLASIVGTPCHDLKVDFPFPSTVRARRIESIAIDVAGQTINLTRPEALTLLNDLLTLFPNSEKL
jgi:hypothetical protein